MSGTSEAAPPEGQATTTSDTQTEAGDEQTTFDADYVKKLRAEAARYRSEAKANADAATRLAQIEEAQKSDAQKAAEATAQAQAQAAKAEAEALRWRIAAKHGIPDDKAELYLTGSDEDALTAQAEGLAALMKSSAEQATTPAPAPRPDLSQGARGDGGATSAEADFASFVTDRLKR